ncbi:MAG: response regulator [Candidatus Eremiobacterota bacterium]
MNNPTVLLVDDDAAVRRVTRRLLERAGYAVVEAESGEQALGRFASGGIDLVLTDLDMPGLGGVELIRSLLRRCPGLGFVIYSGSPDQDLPPGWRFVAKPYAAEELLDRLREAGGKPKLPSAGGRAGP